MASIIYKCYAPGEVPRQEIFQFLEISHQMFSDVLSDAYDLSAFAEKLASKAVAVVSLDSLTGKWLGACFGYCNDGIQRVAYITFIAKIVNRRGVGAGLLKEFECVARKKRMRWLRLEVAKRNVNAQEFYRCMGFEVEREAVESLFLRKML